MPTHSHRPRLRIRRPTRHTPHFLQVPAEVRNRIYYHVNRKNHYVHLGRDGKPVGHPLTQTCRQLRKEYGPIYSNMPLRRVTQVDATVHDFDFNEIEYLLSSADGRLSTPLPKGWTVPVINIHTIITSTTIEEPLRTSQLSKMDTWLWRCEHNHECDRAYVVRFRADQDVKTWAKEVVATMRSRYRNSSEGRYIESVVSQAAYRHDSCLAEQRKRLKQ